MIEHTYKADNFNRLYHMLCADLLYRADYAIRVRSLNTLELFNTHLILTNPYNRILSIPERKTDMFYYAGECCFYWSGSEELNFINKYSTFWNKVSDDNVHVNSCYGSRLFAREYNSYTQYEYAIEQLLFDKHTRKAVMMLSGPFDAIESKDNICTLNLQLIIRDNKLHLINNMRSNDIIFGLTYDLMFFTLLQEQALCELKYNYPDLEMGCYYHNATSTHVYEKHFNMLRAITETVSYNNLNPIMPKLEQDDLHSLYLLLEFEKTLRTTNKQLKNITFKKGSLLEWFANILLANRKRFIKEK